jgi:RNA:NAD 2'-phosphotransferase (TPT1/KptA family)
VKLALMRSETGEDKMQNLSRAASLILRHLQFEYAMHYDVQAFHAPSECHGLIVKGEAKRWRATARKIKALTGHHPKVVIKVIEQRISPKAAYRLGFHEVPVFGTRH